MHVVILGDGHLGRAVADAARGRGDRVRLLGRPDDGRHALAAFRGADVVVEASRASAVLPNVEAALAARADAFVIATTGWEAGARRVDARLQAGDATAVSAANFSLGAALFARLVEVAAAMYGTADGFDPYLIEWHRRSKVDRPSGTARDLAQRLVARHPRINRPGDLETVSIRAGSSPGMHIVGFDAPGETVELRLTARDRSSYAAGILAAADWLVRSRPAPARYSFDNVVDDLLGRSAAAA